MINLLKFSYKFEQSKIINHYKNTSKNEFSRQVIGVHNMKEVEKGICYGLTHSFLRYAHANHEKTYVKEFMRSLKKIQHERTPSNTQSYFINNLFYQAVEKQRVIDYVCNIDNAIHHFKYSHKDLNTSMHQHIKQVIIENYSILVDYRIPESEGLNFIKSINDLYNYTYSTSASHRQNILERKSQIEIDLIKKTAKEIKTKCSSYTINDLSTRCIPLFFQLVKNHQKALIKQKIEQENKNDGIQYDTYTIIDNRVNLNPQNYITFNQFKQRINNRLARKQDTLCDFLSLNHAMGVVIKHVKNKVVFQFFEPNRGLFITTNKNKFFKFLDKMEKKQLFKKNENGEKILQINTSYADNVYNNPLSFKIKQPKMSQS